MRGLVLFTALSVLLFGQSAPAVTLRGTLKSIAKKEIVIETDEAQTIAIHRTGRTKFYKGGKEIKASDIATGVLLAVDVKKDPDLQPEALTVVVSPPPAP